MKLIPKKNEPRRIFFILIATLLFSFLLYAPKPAASTDKNPNEIEVKTSIIEATIYSRDYVRVLRRGKIELKPGLYKFICPDFPSRTSNSSIQVEGSGSAEAKISGINIQDTQNLYTNSLEYKKLLKEMEKLTLQEDSLSIQQKSLNKRLKFVSSLSNFSLESANEELARESFDIKDWQNLLNFIENENTRIEHKISEIKSKSDEIEENINIILRKLKNMRVTKQGKEVVIDCDVISAGDLTLNLTYLVQSAMWTPEFVLRFNKSE